MTSPDPSEHPAPREARPPWKRQPVIGSDIPVWRCGACGLLFLERVEHECVPLSGALPCPYCDGPGELHRMEWADERNVYVTCGAECGAEVGYFRTAAEALEAWNRRSAAPAPPGEAELAALRAVVGEVAAGGCKLPTKWRDEPMQTCIDRGDPPCLGCRARASLAPAREPTP